LREGGTVQVAKYLVEAEKRMGSTRDMEDEACGGITKSLEGGTTLQKKKASRRESEIGEVARNESRTTGEAAHAVSI